jgi:hypothetical protein
MRQGFKLCFKFLDGRARKVSDYHHNNAGKYLCGDTYGDVGRKRSQHFMSGKQMTDGNRRINKQYLLDYAYN